MRARGNVTQVTREQLRRLMLYAIVFGSSATLDHRITDAGGRQFKSNWVTVYSSE